MALQWELVMILTKEGGGATCWILKSTDGIERSVGLVDVPGHDDEHNAYRSEMAGLYDLVKIVQLLKKIGGIIGVTLKWVVMD